MGLRFKIVFWDLDRAFLLLLLISLVSVAWSPAEGQTRYHIGCSLDGCAVRTFEVPAVEKELQIRNWPIEPEAPFLTQREFAGFSRAMEKNPDGKSCLEDTALTPSGYDLSKVDWAKFNSHFSNVDED